MGVEAQFQAMPEDCELFIAARENQVIAESLLFFHRFAFVYESPHPMWDAKWQHAWQLARKLGDEKPDLAKRYFYAGARTFDAIVYLLSPARRDHHAEKDDSLIYQAIYGTERLHPDAAAVQGYPIDFVPAAYVPTIAAYLASITRDMLHEHYDGEYMSTRVYKMSNHDERRFDIIWDEFVGMRDVYAAAAEHNEAVIVTID